MLVISVNFYFLKFNAAFFVKFVVGELIKFQIQFIDAFAHKTECQIKSASCQDTIVHSRLKRHQFDFGITTLAITDRRRYANRSFAFGCIKPRRGGLVFGNLIHAGKHLGCQIEMTQLIQRQWTMI